MTNIEITYMECSCDFCQVYNPKTGYFIVNYSQQDEQKDISISDFIIRNDLTKLFLLIYFINFQTKFGSQNRHEKQLKFLAEELT